MFKKLYFCSIKGGILFDYLLFTVVEPDTTISVTTHVINEYTVFSNGLQLTIRGVEGHALQLFDMTGRLLLTRRSADGTYQILSPGIYILRVDGFRPRKVVMVD